MCRLRYGAARKKSYNKYRELPPYPALIIGPFDSLKWAASPDRRTDYFLAGDTTATTRPGNEMVNGMAGASGMYKGRVRVIHSPEVRKPSETGGDPGHHHNQCGMDPVLPPLCSLRRAE